MASAFGFLVLYVASGIIAGVIFNIINLPKIWLKTNWIVGFVVDFFAGLLCGFVFILTLFRFNYGDFELYQIIAFIIGIIFEIIFVRDILIMPFKFIYKKIRKTKHN